MTPVAGANGAVGGGGGGRKITPCGAPLCTIRCRPGHEPGTTRQNRRWRKFTAQIASSGTWNGMIPDGLTDPTPVLNDFFAEIAPKPVQVSFRSL